MGPFIPAIKLTDPDGVMKELRLAEDIYETTCGEFDLLGQAMTSKGNVVRVWKADPNDPLYDQYFCHGHSLGTYRRFGYSVCSGADILMVLEDDYVEIVTGQTALDPLQLLKVGDIISFSDFFGGIIHSAIVSSIDINPNDPLRPIELTDVILSTKNNYDAVCLKSIVGVRAAYRGAPKMRFWRDKLPCFDDTMQQ